MWPDEVDEVIGGDLTCAVAYVTPAGGAVVTAVAPIGLRDREAGTVGFTTSLGFGRKLERIREEPRIALAYHAREHGLGDAANHHYVLVQGRAEPVEKPTEADRAMVRRLAEARLGSARSGVFWDRWLREYYMVRIPVWVHVERMTVWPDLRCQGDPERYGLPEPAPPEPQPPPAKGTGPRVDMSRVAKRLAKTPYVLLGHVGSDGFPTVGPVEVHGSDASGLELTAPAGVIPPGARRAGLVGHDYKPKLIGLTTRQHTGWVEAGNDRALYAPHTETGFVAPPNKTLLLFFNGLQAKQGVRRARREGALPAA